ncbi:MAG TPA: SAM-dependent methyltransferase [Streptosporangiaceae bacterium]|jgi:hypothetical protein
MHPSCTAGRHRFCRVPRDFAIRGWSGPDTILSSAELRDTIDLNQPVALTLVAILQFITDEAEAHRVVRRLLEPLTLGSVLGLSVVPDANREARWPRAQPPTGPRASR